MPENEFNGLQFCLMYVKMWYIAENEAQICQAAGFESW